MELFTILALAVGLAMDAVAVSIAAGAGVHRLHASYALRISLLFGLFQGLMPLVGWSVGQGFHSVIESVDHWVAFVILLLIGIRMIYHDLGPARPEDKPFREPKRVSSLLALAVATSIDAAAVGIGFIVLSSIVTPLLVIGAVTFVLCIAAVFLGHRYKHLAGQKVNAIGGLILIAIGTKILIEHLSA